MRYKIRMAQRPWGVVVGGDHPPVAVSERKVWLRYVLPRI
jgi:hypothetical protein